jgi:ATP-dependent Lon protease
VRSLKKNIRRIMEKLAFKFVQDPSIEKITVDKQMIEDFLGPPIFASKRIYEKTPPGVVTGLAYNSIGGGILFIEATQANYSQDKSGKGSLQVTGRLGEVMKESSSIAQTYAKTFVNSYLKGHPKALDFLQKEDVHIHFPEGAIPKDGPSAGITITTALISLALEEPCLNNLGMTGEISLNGKVLKIGGVKEKTMAAAREGCTTLIFPAANKNDVERLPENIRAGI